MMYKAFHTIRDVDRLYVKRNKGRSRLASDEEIVHTAILELKKMHKEK